MDSDIQQTPYGWLPSSLSGDRLADLCLDDGVQTGPFGSQLHQEDYVPIGTPIITVEHLGENRIVHQDLPRVSDEDRQRLAKYSLKTGDIVFSRVGSVDRRAIVRESENGWLFSGRCLRVRPDPEKLDSQWLSYFFGLPAFKQHIRGIAVGATMPSINTKILSDVPIYFPALTEQRSAAKCLTSIDDKIDLNRCINQTLEAMAQAIFKSWFVDFDPVKAKITAKQEGRDPLRAAMSAISGKPDAELDTLPPDHYAQLATTAALFPDEMEESELGEIPKGWAVQAMPDCIDVNPSRTLKKGSVARYLDMANVPTNSARVQNIVSREFTSGSKFKNGDTLLARITPCLENGKTAFVDFLNSDEVGWGSTEFIVLRPKNGLPEPYAYFLCRYPDFRAFAISQMAGTSGRQRVPNDCFGGYKLVEPPVQVAVEFGLLAGVALNQIKALDEEARTLASLRDTLLPKLLSGELSVEAIAPTSEATP